MESLGAKLKNLREEKGYTLEQVARDTHIAKRYIIAIEEEQFEEFPAEPYLLGFLRSYCEFLEIDPEEIVQLYRNMRLQEQPPPIEQLVAPRRGPSLRLIIGAIGGVALLAGMVFLLYQLFFAANAETNGGPPAATTVEEYQFNDEVLEQRFRVGDTVIVPLNGREFPIRVAAIEEEVVLDTAGTEQVVAGGGEHGLDISNDGQVDISVVLRSVEASGEAAEAVMRFDRLFASPGGPPEEAAPGPASETAIGATTVPEREREPVQIGVFPTAEAYELTVEFTGPTLFRYRPDGGQTRERFYSAGERLTERFEGRVRIWSSNAGSTRLLVAGSEVRLGGAGEVAAGAIRYVETGDGRQQLELIPAY